MVGNGPVGQTAALLLARWGVPCVVLDRRPERDVIGSKAICQHRDVIDIWAAVGVGEQVAREGVTWSTARTFHQGAELFSYTLTDPGRSPFPPFVNLSQSRTEELLDAAVGAEPLIDVRWGCEVTGITQDSAGVTVECGSVGVRGPYAILCAGASCGELRRQLGVTFEGESFDDRFLICDIKADLAGWATERRFHFDPSWNPGRQVLIHPTPGSTFRIDWQVAAGYDLEAEAASGALDARIRAVIGETAYEIVWMSVYRFHSRCVDRMRVGRVLLAGDAAHLMSPFGARGLNSGVADAENAAWKLAYLLRGWAGPELLESYHAERHAAAAENIAVTTATMDFLVPPDAPRKAHRTDVLTRAAADPAVRAQVDSGRLYEPFWYVDSPLTTPDPGRPFAGRPPRGQSPPPGPGTLVPDTPLTDGTNKTDGTDGAPGKGRKATFLPPEGRKVAFLPSPRSGSRLREVARDGFLLLAAPDVDPAELAAAAEAATGPVRVLALDAVDPTGELLGAGSGEVFVVRPDAHIAAVVPTAAVAEALGRALGGPHHPVPADREEVNDGVLPQHR
ncbi:FAD-dependent monooxygenase [Pseudonocardia sp. TRM90224]|uniref:FAD-dependent monooxygenase n=1 Tax=Pseudonocardia sp. TRM90224 TaxID=2812678 RepID=UPI001E3AA211|nr:FAD-dependent monooxygenase [Pseudonocardia sp. TRM90224]